MTGRLVATAARRTRSSGSLVRIRSPARLGARPWHRPGRRCQPRLAGRLRRGRPDDRSRTSTPRSSRARLTWRPCRSRHACATTIALLRSFSPSRPATRSRAIIARSPRSTRPGRGTDTRSRAEPNGHRYRRRRAWRRMAPTLAANAVGSMIGVPRHGDIDSRSVSLDTTISAPTSAARSRIRLSSWSGQS